MSKKNSQEALQQNTLLDIQDSLVSCLVGLLVVSQRYRITFGNHIAEDELLEFHKAKVMELNKYVDRIDKKMPETYILTFKDFTGYIVLKPNLTYEFTHNGIILHYATYDLKIEKL